MDIFNKPINNWDEWTEIVESADAFTLLIESIFKNEGLPIVKIEALNTGIHAIFKCSEYVIKILAPPECGRDFSQDLLAESFSMKRANKIGVSSPKLIADGIFNDKYRFAYLIMDYIQGAVEFKEAVTNMSETEKIAVGLKIRAITDKMNTPCEPFNRYDVLNDKGRNQGFRNFSDLFQKERLEYLKSYEYGEKVFVHGDLHNKNVLLSENGEIFFIDFADAKIANKTYEHVVIISELFEFDVALLKGFFGDYTVDELTEVYFHGLLLHDWCDILVHEKFGEPGQFNTLEQLRSMVKLKFTKVMDE
jgi:serine/threonine protein kinase